MKIKMLTSMSGPSVQRNRGDEIDVPTAEASRLIEAGFAEPVRNPPREKATSRAPREETTVAPAADGKDAPATEVTAVPDASSAEDEGDTAQPADEAAE